MRACREISNFLYYSVDDAHLQIIKVIRDVYLIIVWVNQSSFTRAEVHQGAVVIGLLLSQRVGRGAASAVLYDLMLQGHSYIFSCFESLGLIAVIFVADGECLAGLDLSAELVSSETGDIYFVDL